MEKNTKKGFTLLEILIVITIIALIIAIVMVTLGEAKEQGRDSARKSQIQEVLKSLEFFYTDYGMYPRQNGGSGQGGTLDNIDTDYYGVNDYLTKLPPEPERYYYCVSTDRDSFILALNTEVDKGGSDWCHILRGKGPDYGCDLNDMNGGLPEVLSALDTCASRF